MGSPHPSCGCDYCRSADWNDADVLAYAASFNPYRQPYHGTRGGPARDTSRAFGGPTKPAPRTEPPAHNQEQVDNAGIPEDHAVRDPASRLPEPVELRLVDAYRLVLRDLLGGR